MAEFTIQEIQDLDDVWPDLRSLFLELHSYHEPWTPRTLRTDWEQRWRDYLSSGTERLILLARSDSRAVGYLNAGVRRDSGLFDELVGFIDDAYVQEQWRGLGIGAALLERVEAWMMRLGPDEVRLNVMGGNELGMRFWTGKGFQTLNQTMTKTLGASTR